MAIPPDIQTILRSATPFPGIDWSTFASHLHHTILEKGSHLIRAGAVEKRLYLLESGVLRFYLEKEEKEITFDFCFPVSFFCAFTSFITGLPVRYSIQALTPCTLYSIPKDILEESYRRQPETLAVGKWAAEQQFLRKSARELSLLVDRPEDRYRALLQKEPVLLQEIPLKYLASYIGITPQALSRIRRRLSVN